MKTPTKHVKYFKKKSIYFICFALFFAIVPSLGRSKNNNQDQENKLKTHQDNMFMINTVLNLIKNYHVDRLSMTVDQILFGTFGEISLYYPLSFEKKNKKIDVFFEGKKFYSFPSEKIKQKNLLEAFFLLGLKIDEFNKKLKIKDILSHPLHFTDLFSEDGVYKVLDSLTSYLDAHSSLMSSEEFLELKQGTEGSFGGIGVMVGIKNHILTIMDVMKGSPAERLGLKKYDIILSIDGRDAFETSMDDLIKFMKGPPETFVQIQVLSQKNGIPKTFKIKRELITVKDVETKVFSRKGKNFFYASINTFSQKITEDLKSSFLKFSQKYKTNNGVILDLRSNPGGLLDQAVSLVDLFIQKGLIVSTKGRFAEQEEAKDDFIDESYPMVVLMNEDSASASEIVAGALQDHKRALIIGQKSFGKGSVQTIFDLPKERALKLTISRYYTPSGKSIQNLGITPDFWLQPIIKKDENNNLLGSWRYKNERFLDHRLENIESGESKKEFFKSYYLSGGTDDPKESSKDEELELALIYLIKSEQNKTIEENITRSYQDLKKYMNHLENKTISFLEKKFSVQWDEFQNNCAQEDLSLNFQIPKFQEFSIGDEISIPFSIKTKNPCHRLSIYGRGKKEIGTTEVLIGSVEKEKKGIFTFKVENHHQKDHPLYVDLGIALDSIPLVGIPTKTLSFKIKKTEEVLPFKINYKLNDQDSKKKFHISDTLESEEKAYLEFVFEKQEKQSFQNFDFSIENLSGVQVLLGDKKTWIQDISKKNQWIIKIPITGGSYIRHKDLRFGIEIINKNNPDPMIRKTIHILGEINGFE